VQLGHTGSGRVFQPVELGVHELTELLAVRLDFGERFRDRLVWIRLEERLAFLDDRCEDLGYLFGFCDKQPQISLVSVLSLLQKPE
jgi:hypothetical protein